MSTQEKIGLGATSGESKYGFIEPPGQSFVRFQPACKPFKFFYFRKTGRATNFRTYPLTSE